MRAVRALLVLLAATAAFATSDQTFSLVWAPKQGEEFKYSIVLASTLEGAKIVIGTDLGVKVTAVAANGDYTLESRYSTVKVTLNGEPQSLKDLPPAQVEIEKYNAKGVRFDDGKDQEVDQFGQILSDVMDFVPPEKPVKVGDKWTRSVPENEKTKKAPARLDYTVLSEEKSGPTTLVKLGFAYTETKGDKPAHGTGEFLIDASNGLVISAKADLENAKMDPEAPPGPVKVTLTLEPRH